MKKYLSLVILVQFILLPFTAAANPEFVLKTSSGDLNVTKYKSYYYVSFDLNQPGALSLISKIPVKNVEISPKSYHIPFNLKGNIISFQMKKPGYVMVRINDTLKVFLFAEQPERIPTGNQTTDIVRQYHIDATGQTCETQKIQQALDELSGSGKTLIFPPGTYKSGQLQIRSNSNVYFARGAILNADTSSISPYYSMDSINTKRFISLNKVENVSVKGYGILNGNGWILRSKYGDDARMRLVLAVNSRNIRLEGLMLKDPGSWNTQVLQCENVVLKNIKLLNDINLGNTDGFDPDGTKRMLIENCFAYCSDDNVAIKTTGYTGIPGNVEDITVKGCIFLTKKSAMKVGTETRGEIMKNITFENNDVIECDRGMAIYVSDGAQLDNIVFRNNRFERNYPDQQRKAIHFVVSRRNPDSKLGSIKNVLIKDCNFDMSFPKKSLIKYEGDKMGIEVTIDNLVIAGQKAETTESAGIEVTNALINFK